MKNSMIRSMLHNIYYRTPLMTIPEYLSIGDRLCQQMAMYHSMVSLSPRGMQIYWYCVWLLGMFVTKQAIIHYIFLIFTHLLIWWHIHVPPPPPIQVKLIFQNSLKNSEMFFYFLTFKTIHKGQNISQTVKAPMSYTS